MDPGVPLPFKKHHRTRLPPPPGGASEGLVVCRNFFGMQITRHWKRGVSTKQYAELRHISKGLLGRKRHLYVCSRCGMPLESWPK